MKKNKEINYLIKTRQFYYEMWRSGKNSYPIVHTLFKIRRCSKYMVETTITSLAEESSGECSYQKPYRKSIGLLGWDGELDLERAKLVTKAQYMCLLDSWKRYPTW